MQNKHSPEPWSIGRQYIIDYNQNNIAEHLSFFKRDAERIVACVNACQGIPIEELEHFARLGKCGLEAVKGLDGKPL